MCGPSCMKRHFAAWRFASGRGSGQPREGVLSPTSTIRREPLVSRRSGTLRRDGAAVQSADPDRKGKVESGVNHAQMTPLKGKKFESLEEAQAYLDHWEDRWAINASTPCQTQVAAMFVEEALLATASVGAVPYYQYGERTVHLDGCVEVEAAYTEPAGWIAQGQGAVTRCSCACLIPHGVATRTPAQRGAHRIRDGDRPRRTPPRASTAGTWAQGGASIGAVCDAIHARQANSEYVASKAFFNWSSNTAAQLATMLVRRRWNCASPSIASCAATWSAIRRLLSA